MNGRYFVPNFLTMLNAASGLLGIVMIARQEVVAAVICVALALALDFLDGFVARVLNAQSQLGVQLDSLADVITFGALPGFMLFEIIAATSGSYYIPLTNWSWTTWFLVLPAFAVPMAAAYRLGRFNLDQTVREHFLGLPVPAMCLVVMSFPLILAEQYHLNFYNTIGPSTMDNLARALRWDAGDIAVVNVLIQPGTYVLLSVFLATAMVIKIPMISLKFKGLGWRKNRWRYAIMLWGLVCYILFLIPYIPVSFSYGALDYLIAPIFMLGYFILSWIYATFDASNQFSGENEIQS